MVYAHDVWHGDCSELCPEHFHQRAMLAPQTTCLQPGSSRALSTFTYFTSTSQILGYFGVLLFFFVFLFFRGMFSFSALRIYTRLPAVNKHSSHTCQRVLSKNINRGMLQYNIEYRYLGLMRREQTMPVVATERQSLQTLNIQHNCMWDVIAETSARDVLAINARMQESQVCACSLIFPGLIPSANKSFPVTI